LASRDVFRGFDRADRITGLGAVPKITLTSAPRPVPRIDYERIFVLDGNNRMLSEFVLNDECPTEFDDLSRSIPPDGLEHGKSIFREEYVFTPFRVDDLKFVIVTRGTPGIRERGFIGSLLAAAKIHLGSFLEPSPSRPE